MTINLDRIILTGQIEQGYDYTKFIQRIDEGIAYLHQNKAPFEPTLLAKEKYGDVHPSIRRIEFKIIKKEIYYLVTDEGIPSGKDMSFPLRVKGYVQGVSQGEIKEVPKERMQAFAKYIGSNVGEDLIE